MTTTELATRDEAQMLARVLIQGDLSVLSPEERVAYYLRVCRSLGLNEFTRPFDYLEMAVGRGEAKKLTLYANATAASQLRDLRGISVTDVDPRQVGDVYVVVAHGKDKHGRIDSSTGAVNVKGLFGVQLANAMMHAETKAKRRLTLSMCGLSMLDDSQLDGVPDAVPVNVDPSTGEILDVVTSADDRHWKLYQKRLVEARGYGLKVTEVRLGITRDDLIVEGKKISALIDERVVKTVEHPLYQKLAALVQDAALLDIDTARYQLSIPAPVAQFEDRIGQIQEAILAAETRASDGQAA